MKKDFSNVVPITVWMAWRDHLKDWTLSVAAEQFCWIQKDITQL